MKKGKVVQQMRVKTKKTLSSAGETKTFLQISHQNFSSII